MCNACLDRTLTDAFAERMGGMLNDAALALMISIGHRTGLFDAMAGLAPSTSAQIAAAAGLNERYVREWLGAMVAGRIVTYDAPGEKYALPAEHASSLTRDSENGNIAVVTQFISVLGGVEDRIVDCFRAGGGVPYEEFNRFHEVMAEESGQTVIPALLEDILPLAPGVIEQLVDGIDVVDVGCGRGRALIELAAAFPQSRFTGVDISVEAISNAREAAAARGLSNIEFRAEDAATFCVPEGFDLVLTFDAVHDQAKPAQVLSNIRRSLKPDGVYLMQDIAGSSAVENNIEHPLGAFMYTISCMHCMTVSLSAGGAGLGAMWGKETALSMLADAGFTNVNVKELPHDEMNYYYVARAA